VCEKERITSARVFSEKMFLAIQQTHLHLIQFTSILHINYILSQVATN